MVTYFLYESEVDGRAALYTERRQFIVRMLNWTSRGSKGERKP